MDSRGKRWLSVAAALAVVVAAAATIYVIGPESLVAAVGVENAYLVVFLLAIFGGVSTLTATSFFAAVIAMAAGGLHPLWLGLVSGVGMLLGDLIFFALGAHARTVAGPRMRPRLERWAAWIRRKPDWGVALFIYLYLAATPLPGDLLLAALALAAYPIKKLIVPVLLGNITLITLLSTLSRLGVDLLG
jgi:membrane protein YqaA with SNARE-associated domain